VFTKLGISSRTQLDDALSNDPNATQAVEPLLVPVVPRVRDSPGTFGS
jgi:hypothetical protein